MKSLFQMTKKMIYVSQNILGDFFCIYKNKKFIGIYDKEKKQCEASVYQDFINF